MNPQRIAVATAAFDQPLKTALQTAADMGADAVQFDARGELRPADLSETGRRQLLHHLDELNLGIASLALPVRRAFYDLDQLDARLARTREVMQFAWQLKAPLVTLRVGRIPVAGSEEYRLLVEVLNDLARHGNHVGAVLAVTPTRDEPESLARLMGEITQGPVGIDFDPAGFAMNGTDAIAAYRELHQMVTHVLIRDGLRDIDGSGREVPVGRGEVDWTELIPMIDESSYRGPLTVVRTVGDDCIGDCARAIQFLRRLRLG